MVWVKCPTICVEFVVVSSVFEQQADLARVAVLGRQVQRRVAAAVRRGRGHAVQDEELGGHHTPGQDALQQRHSLASSYTHLTGT